MVHLGQPSKQKCYCLVTSFQERIMIIENTRGIKMKKVFIKGNDPKTRACFGWQDIDSAFWGLSFGYKNAADKLVDFAIQAGDNKTLDTFFFPIMYLYRHALEVSLKSIYHRFNGKVLHGHELDCLWKKVRDEILNEIDSDEFFAMVQGYKKDAVRWVRDNDGLNEIENLFKELQNWDKKSDTWRYLVDINGLLFFTQQEYVDYINLKTTIGDLINKLDDLYSVISGYLSS